MQVYNIQSSLSILHICRVLGIAYERENVPLDEWERWEAEKQDLDAYPFNQVPILMVDGLIIAQQYVDFSLDHPSIS